jgi:hypothetical protein
MSDGKGKPMPTVLVEGVKGNALFEKAVVAIGLDDSTTRWLCVSVLKTIGTRPEQLTPEELGNLLPEVDRRLRKLVQEAQADAAMKRLYRVLFEQAGSA